MRYRLQIFALSAALIATGATGAAAKQNRHSPPRRTTGHVSLHVNHHSLMAGQRLVLDGKVNPGGNHRVKVVVQGRSGGVSRAVTERDGTYRIDFRLPSTGVYEVKAFGIHDRHVTSSASDVRTFTVYRQAAASYYGPGLYGGALACGGTLEPGTLGVAHKTLPCGTRVHLRYHGRSITVRVIDRGPYVAGRDYDLTEATKQRLGFPSTGTVLSSR